MSGNGRTIVVDFIPQAEISKHIVAVDPDGPATFEVSESEALRLTGCESIEAIAPHSYDSDRLRDASNVPEWIRNWSGPFECEITEINPSDEESES